jgi:hypothetical protein
MDGRWETGTPDARRQSEDGRRKTEDGGLGSFDFGYSRGGFLAS